MAADSRVKEACKLVIEELGFAAAGMLHKKFEVGNDLLNIIDYLQSVADDSMPKDHRKELADTLWLLAKTARTKGNNGEGDKYGTALFLAAYWATGVQHTFPKTITGMPAPHDIGAYALRNAKGWAETARELRKKYGITQKFDN